MCLLLVVLPAVHPQGTGQSTESAAGESAAMVALPARPCSLSRLPPFVNTCIAPPCTDYLY